MNLDQHSIWSLLLSAFGFVLWNMFNKAQRDVTALQDQNAKQETAIATLQANGTAHDVNTERLASAIERLDTKIDQLAQSLANRRASDKPHAR